MIDKFRKIVNSAEELESIKNSVKQGIKDFEEFKKRIQDTEKEFKQKLHSYEEAGKQIIDEKRQSISKLNKICDDFQKELNDFKTLKTKLRTDVIEKATSEMKEELRTYLLNVRGNIDKLNQAADEIKKLSTNTDQILGCLNDLKDVAKNIKKEDFELTKHAEQLRKNDKEKLELMRRIDTLERLIARQRRR